MAKSFLDSVKNVNNIKNIDEQAITIAKQEIKAEEYVYIEPISISKDKSKPGRKPTRKAIYIKRTIELREDQLEILDKLAFDKRTSKREEIEKALEMYIKSI